MTLGELAQALERGVRGAVAMMVLAVAGAMLFPHGDAERFGTAAYVAAIFTAVMLIARRCLPSPERTRVNDAESSAEIVALWVVAAGAVAASSLAAGSLAAEVFVGIACTIAVFVAAVLPKGLVAAIQRELSRGGDAMAVARYAVLASLAGWALAAYVHADSVSAAVFGFVLCAIACTMEMIASRPMRDMIGATSLATVAAFAIAACVPAFAEAAAAIGYAAAVFTMMLLILRRRYA
jgi:uncharacterized membrane protein YfcA